MSTKIEWTDVTWNPVTGCTKVSAGCKNCYAERLAPKVFAGQTVEVDTTPPKHPEMKAAAYRPRHFTDVLCHPERLDAPLHWKKPRRIFVNSMSDLFHEDVPGDFIDHVIDTIKAAPQHTFQALTKRPGRMQAFMRHYGAIANLWLGVSVEDQATAYERIPLLTRTLAAVRFISAEPLLDAIDVTPWLRRIAGSYPQNPMNHERLDWVIAGGESGPHARPAHPDWFRSLRDQCATAGVPFFFKQWGEWEFRDEWPSEYKSRRGAWLHKDGWLTDGKLGIDPTSEPVQMVRVGKKAAGRTLDGRIHDEYPA